MPINAFHQLIKSMRVYGKVASCNHSCFVMLCLSKPLAFVFSGVLLIQRSFLGMGFTSIPQSQTPLDRRLCSFLAPLHLLSQPPLLAVAPPLVPALAPLLAPLLAPDIEDPLHVKRLRILCLLHRSAKVYSSKLVQCFHNIRPAPGPSWNLLLVLPVNKHLTKQCSCQLSYQLLAFSCLAKPSAFEVLSPQGNWLPILKTLPTTILIQVNRNFCQQVLVAPNQRN